MKTFRQVISPKNMTFLRLIPRWKQLHDIDIHPSANQFLKQRPVEKSNLTVNVSFDFRVTSVQFAYKTSHQNNSGWILADVLGSTLVICRFLLFLEGREVLYDFTFRGNISQSFWWSWPSWDSKDLLVHRKPGFIHVLDWHCTSGGWSFTVTFCPNATTHVRQLCGERSSSSIGFSHACKVDHWRQSCDTPSPGLVSQVARTCRRVQRGGGVTQTSHTWRQLVRQSGRTFSSGCLKLFSSQFAQIILALCIAESRGGHPCNILLFTYPGTES